MNILLPRVLRVAYRRDPIPSFLVTMGVADIALGGLSSHGGLLILGLLIAGGALGMKWIQGQRRNDLFTEPLPQRYLPPSPSQTELPMLSIHKKRPPSDF